MLIPCVQQSDWAMYRTSLIAHSVKNLPAMQETQVQFLDWEDPMEKGMVTHSSNLAWKIPWTEKPSGLQSLELQRVRHDWRTITFTIYTFFAGLPWWLSICRQCIWSISQEDPLEEGRATYSNILAWRITWTEEPGGLQSIGLQSQACQKRLSTHIHSSL